MFFLLLATSDFGCLPLILAHVLQWQTNFVTMSQQLPHLIACLILSILACTVTARQCYYPDGSESNDVACSDDDVVQCCDKDSICLSNGYCLNTYPNAYSVARSSCTDSAWGSDCPQQCIEVWLTPPPPSALPPYLLPYHL